MKLSPGRTLCRFCGLQSDSLHPLEKLLLVVGLFLSVAAFLVSLKDVSHYAGVDLRNRVVGARLMLAGHDPYFFNWQPGMPLEWLDPVQDRQERVRRLSVPPTVLWLYAPMAGLHYKAQRYLSCVLEWTAMVVSIALLSRLLPEQRLRVIFLIGAVLFFVLADFWRFHVERGQVYVFHVLALSVGTFWAQRDGPTSWRAGVAIGIAALMRLNLGILIPAFFLVRRWRTSVAAALTLIVGFLGTLPFTPVGSWHSFFSVANQVYVVSWNPESLERIPSAQHRGAVEGYDFDQFMHGRGYPTSFDFWYSRVHRRLGLPLLDLGLVSKLLLGCLAIFLLVLLGLAHRRRPSTASVFLLTLTLAVASEFFLPARVEYADVVLLLPLVLALPFMLEVRLDSQVATFLVLTGLVASLVLWGPETSWSAPLRSWLVMGGTSALAFWRWKEVLSGTAPAV